MGSEGRRTRAYRRVSAEFRTGHYLCHLCGERPGTTVDHVPPLSTFPHPSMWHGTYKPACPTCQGQQGARIVNERRRPSSRRW